MSNPNDMTDLTSMLQLSLILRKGAATESDFLHVSLHDSLARNSFCFSSAISRACLVIILSLSLNNSLKQSMEFGTLCFFAFVEDFDILLLVIKVGLKGTAKITVGRQKDGRDNGTTCLMRRMVRQRVQRDDGMTRQTG
jgi:hypothetical protein